MFSDKTYITFAAVNLIYGLFNLLPFWGLDGGNALEEALTKKKGYEFAVRVLNSVTVCAAVFSLAVAVFLSIMEKTNYSAYIFSLYLVLSVLFKF